MHQLAGQSGDVLLASGRGSARGISPISVNLRSKFEADLGV
jgi:hypothetical protein